MSSISLSIENSYRCRSVCLVVQTQRHATALHSSFVWLDMLLVLSALTLILQLFWPVIISWHYRPQSGNQAPAQFHGVNGILNYWLCLPSSYSSSGNTRPVLLYLHGAGSCGNSLELVSQKWPLSRCRTTGHANCRGFSSMP